MDGRGLGEVAVSLGGIIGWLTYYGWHRAFGGKSLREGAEVDDRSLTKLLEHLVKMGVLEKVGNEYVIADPVLHYGILRYL